MKPNMLAPLAVLVYVNQVLGQSLLSTSTSVVEIFDDSCSDVDLITDYKTVTITTCPACTEHPGPITQHTTVYTTVYANICSTGWTSNTYTVTETCIGVTPSWSSGTGYIPQGFTETVTVCSVCGSNPTKVTLTVPCQETRQGIAASPGTPGWLPGAPAQATPLGAAASGAGAANAGGSMANPPYPTGANSTLIKCPGPYCQGTNSLLPSTGGVGTGANGAQSPSASINGSSSVFSFTWLHLIGTLSMAVASMMVWL